MRTRHLAVALLILLTLTACASGGPTEPDPISIDDFAPAVAVTGKLLPATWADLTATGAGQIVAVLVETGDRVAEGDVLIRLDSRDAEAAVRQAEVAVLQAERELARMVAAPAEEAVAVATAQIQAARAALTQTIAQREALQTGQLDAQLAQAEAALEAAQLQLEHTVVRAPFGGTVGALRVRRGELAAPGMPLLTLGDLATLRVEITDLDEIDVSRVAVGQTAVVTFDALPDRTFSGEVVRIAPMAATTGGGVTYTTILALDELDAQLRWGMTAFVDIATAP